MSQEEEAARAEAEKLRKQDAIKKHLPKEPADEKTEGVPVAQLRFRIPATSSESCDQNGPGKQWTRSGHYHNSILLTFHNQVSV